MKELDTFNLPFQGLEVGIHHYHYLINGQFFQVFENSLIEEASIEVAVTLDKRYELSILTIKHEGIVVTDCDRCLEKINLPIQGDKDLMIKYVHEVKEDEEEIIYIFPDCEKLNIAPFIYEFVSLSLPMAKIYDCENNPNAPCNEEVLSYLNPEEDSEESNPVWEELKKLDFNKN